MPVLAPHMTPLRHREAALHWLHLMLYQQQQVSSLSVYEHVLNSFFYISL